MAFEGKTGSALFDELDEIRKAGLLNIAAKASRPCWPKPKPFPQVQQLLEVRSDRFFARMAKELREETKNSVDAGLFRPVDGSLHHPPARFLGVRLQNMKSASENFN